MAGFDLESENEPVDAARGFHASSQLLPRAELPGRPERVFGDGDGRLLFSVREIGPVDNEDLLGIADGLVCRRGDLNSCPWRNVT